MVVPTSKRLPGLWLEETEITSQLSSGTGAIQLTRASHCPGLAFTVMSTLIPERVGPSESFTVTWKAAVLRFPDTSTAVYSTVVVPTPKSDPGGWLEVKVEIPQSSDAVGSSHVTIAPQTPRSEFEAIGAGRLLMTGGIESASISQSSGTEFRLQSLLPPVAISQLSRRPFELQSNPVEAINSHSSGFESESQSLLIPESISHSSGTAFTLQS